jgi:hypothetical protein
VRLNPPLLQGLAVSVAVHRSSLIAKSQRTHACSLPDFAGMSRELLLAVLAAPGPPQLIIIGHLELTEK